MAHQSTISAVRAAQKERAAGRTTSKAAAVAAHMGLDTEFKRKPASIGDAAVYTGASLVAGAGSVVEGVVDLVAAPVVAITDGKEAAKDVFKDTKVNNWREGLRQDLNMGAEGGVAGTVGEFLGDVTHGIGQSSAFILDAFVPGLGTSIYAAGTASQGIGQAAQKTGDVGFKEIGYGLTTAAVETTIGRALGGGARAAKNLATTVGKTAAKGAAKTAAKAAAKETVEAGVEAGVKAGAKGTAMSAIKAGIQKAGQSTAGSVIKETVKGAAGEGAEEFTSAVLEPGILRLWNIDEEATFNMKDALYQAAVGAVSGGTMTAPAAAGNFASARKRGAKLTEQGRADEVVQIARSSRDVAQVYIEGRNAQKKAGKTKTEEGAGKTSRIASIRARHQWKKDDKRTEQYAVALDKGLEAWDKLGESGRRSPSGLALLGEIERNTLHFEITDSIARAGDRILEADDADLLALVAEINRTAKDSGRPAAYTLDDLKSDRDGILSQVAAIHVIDELQKATTTQNQPATAQEPSKTAQEPVKAEAALTAQEPPKTAQEPAKAEVAPTAGLRQNEQPTYFLAREKPTQRDAEEVYGKMWSKNHGDRYARPNIDAIFAKTYVGINIPPAIQEIMRYDYDRYGDGMHPSLFIHAYTNEYLRGKIGSNRSTGVENPPIRAEAEAHARELGRRMAVQEAKRKEKALLERAEAGKTQTSGDADVRYSIRRTAGGEEIVVIDTDQDIFEGVERSEYGRVVGRYFLEHYQGRELAGVHFNATSKREYTHSNYTTGMYKKNNGIYEAKMKAGTELENMIRTGSFLRHEDAKHPMQFNQNGYDIYQVRFEIDGERFNAEMLVAMGENERRTFYDIEKIKKESRPTVVLSPKGELTVSTTTSSEDSIPQKDGVVNSKSENKNRESKRKQYDHIHFPSKYARKHLSERKQATAEAAEVLANALGTEIYFYQSYERDGKRYYKENGKERIAPNGFIDANKHIHIDLNSGMDGRGIGIFTLAHETAHFIHDYDPVAFHDMAAEVVRRIEGTGVDMHRKVLDKLSDLDKRGVLAGMSFEEMYDYAHEEIIADALEPMLADGRTLSEVVDANPSLFRKIIDHIKAIIQKIKNAFAGMKPDSEAGQVVQAMMDSMEDVREMFSSAILTAGERRRAVGSGANTSTTYTIRFSDGDSMDRGESKQIIRIIHENEKSIPTQLSFDVRYSNEVENYQKKSEYVSSIFDEQGNEAFHPVIGRVELVKSGAKSTITHGYGHEKLSAIRAIKPAIENGNIISYVQNYGGKNVDRYVIAAKGLINGHEAYIGVVVKSYPTQKTDNKFYLHEVEIIETDSPVMTAPQLSVDTVRESASTDSIPQSEANVNTMGQKNSDRPFDDAVERMYAREAGEEADAAKETPLAPRPKDEYTTRALLRELLSTKITRKDDRAFMERYGEKLAELDHWKAEIERMERPLNGHRARRAELQRKIDGAKEGVSSVVESKRKAWIAERDAEKKAEKAARAMLDVSEEYATYTKQVAEAEEAVRHMEATEAARNVLRHAEKNIERSASAHERVSLQEQRKQIKEEERAKSKERKERLERSEDRRKAMKILAKWNNVLKKDDKTHNIPDAIKSTVIDFIQSINRNSDLVNEAERVADLQAKIDAELKKPNPNEKKIEIWEKDMCRIQDKGEWCRTIQDNLENMYNELKTSRNPDVRSSYDEEVEKYIHTMRTLFTDKDGKKRNLADFTTKEMHSFYRLIQTVDHSIVNHRKITLDGKKQEIADVAAHVEEELQAVIDEHGKRKGIPGADGQTLTIVKKLKSAYFNELKPIYFFDDIQSPTLRKLFKDVYQQGEHTGARDLVEIHAFKRRMDKKYHTADWDTETRRTFMTKSGEVRLNLGHMLSIYADAKREQAVGHLLTGGFCLDPNEEANLKIKDKYNTPIKTSIDNAETYRLTEAQMWKIVEGLSDDQRKYVDEMVEFLSTVMADKGNEVSLKLYGIRLFKEKFYFPIKTKDAFRAVQNTAQYGQKNVEPMLKSLGMTKPTVPDANTPIVLSDFDDVWAKHCADMTSYHALVLPIENLRRVFEYGTTKDEIGASSVKASLIDAYGQAAVDYISKLLADSNGGIRVDTTTTLPGKMISLFKKGATMMSASVIIQQPTSIFRAMAMVDPKYFVTTKGLKVGKANADGWELIKRYSDTAVIKDMGFFDTGMGRRTADFINAREYEGAKEKGKAFLKDSGYRDEVLSLGPAMADRVTWMTIWEAICNETADTHTELQRDTDEFYKVVGERFDEVIRYTQVYDSMLSRSGFMRDKNAIVQMATAFMAEPTTTVNMLLKYTRQAVKGDRKKVAQAFGAILCALIFNALAASLVYAMRDDDEEKTYGEKYVENVADGLNPLTLFPGMLPFFRDIVSICEGYDVERTDMAIVGDVVNAFKVLQSSTKEPYEKVETFAGAVGNAFGLPARNVIRDTRAVMRTIGSVGEDTTETTTGAGIKYALKEGFLGKEASNGQQLYEAALNNDTAHYNRVMARYEDEGKAKTALRRALRDNDPRIAEAADAFESGDTATYVAIRRQIIAEGYFEEADVVAAINSERNAIQREMEATNRIKKGASVL